MLQRELDNPNSSGLNLPVWRDQKNWPIYKATLGPTFILNQEHRQYLEQFLEDGGEISLGRHEY